MLHRLSVNGELVVVLVHPESREPAFGIRRERFLQPLAECHFRQSGLVSDFNRLAALRQLLVVTEEHRSDVFDKLSPMLEK